MNKNKIILTYCPNFYRIINFDFFEGDYITEKLINIYEEYIFSININDEKEIKKAEYIDKIISKYIEDYTFRKEMKFELVQIKVKANPNKILKIIVDKIINIFDDYEEGFTRNIYVTRWI